MPIDSPDVVVGARPTSISDRGRKGQLAIANPGGQFSRNMAMVRKRLYPCDRHFIHEQRPAANPATHILVITDCPNSLVQVFQVPCNRDFVHRICDLSVLDPVTNGAAGVVARHTVNALANQLLHDQPGAHFTDE